MAASRESFGLNLPRAGRQFAPMLGGRGGRTPTGMPAAALGLDELLETKTGQTVHLVLPGANGRFVINREFFRERGSATSCWCWLKWRAR